MKIEKKPEESNKKSWKKCYPFELNENPDDFEYKSLSTHAKNLKEISNLFDNIEVYTPPEGEGKTLEYELAIANPSCNLLLTDSFPSKGKNRKAFFEEIMQAYDDNKSLDELIALCNHEDIVELINSSTWEDSEKKKALIASIYYEAIENMKGEHAFYLENKLRENYSNTDGKESFCIPPYIKNSIDYITG
jgi:hypothetical protein